MFGKIKFKVSVLASVLVASGILAGPAQAQGFMGLTFNPDKNIQDIEQKFSPKTQAQELNGLLSGNIGARANKSSTGNTSIDIRRQALVELGSSIGASSGLVFRSEQIKKEVNQNGDRLDALFDFTKMAIDNGVLPPVLTEGLSNYAQESSDVVRIADKIYKIEAPAKFVSSYPTWRSYLIFSFPQPEDPPAAFLPKDATERGIWDEAVKFGWSKGVSQANNIFETSFNRLTRDYLGMIKYKVLLAEGLITPTIIAKQNMGVTGGGLEMSINDQVFRIADHSALNPNKNDWKVEYPVTNNINGVLR